MVKYVPVVQDMIQEFERNQILLELISDFSYSCSCDLSQDKKSHKNCKFDYLTDSFFDFTGYNKNCLDLNEFWMIIHPEDRKVVEKQLELTEPGSKDVFEFRIRGSDDKIIWLKNYIYCVEDGNQGVSRIYGAALNITEAKTSEKETKDMVEFFETLTDNMPSSIFYKDINGVYIGCNKEYTEFLGLNKDEIIGKSVYDVFSKDLADEYHKMDMELLKKQGKQFFHWKMDHSDGTTHDVLFNKATYSNTEGELVGIVGVMVDITDLKQIERSLRESEEKYRLLVENSSDVIWTMSLDGYFTFLTPVIEELSGYTPEEAMNLHLSDYIVEDYYPKVMRELLKQLNKPVNERASSKYMELKMYRKDRSIIDIEISTKWIYDDVGNPVGLQGSTKNISERKEVEKALKRSESLYRTIFENTGAATLLFNKQGIITMINTELERIFGYSKAEVVNKMSWMKFVPPEKLPMMMEYHEQREIDPKSTSSTYETEFITKSGEVLTTQITVDKIPNSDEFVTSVLDITDLVKTQNALKESEEKFRQMAENIEEVMYIIDPKEGEILYISPSYEKIWGRSREEVYKEPKSWIEAIHSDDRKKARNHIFTADCEVISPDDPEIEYRIIKPDGTIRWIWGRAFPVLDNKGAPYRIAGIALDITDRKLAEEEVKSSLKEKELLLREIHHRVKNNLQIIVSLLNLQIEHVDDKLTMEILTESQNRVKSMATLLEKLYESPDLKHINFRYYIEKLVTDLFYSYNVKVGTITPIIKTMDFDMGIDTAIPCGLILNELVTNSIKYAFPDGRKGKVTVDFSKKKDEFILKVADNGVGMSENIQQGSPQTLGFQLVENLVSQLDGTITSKVNNGTEFIIKFKELIYKDRL